MSPGAVTSSAIVIKLSYGSGPGYEPCRCPLHSFFYRRDLTAEWGVPGTVDGNFMSACHRRGACGILPDGQISPILPGVVSSNRPAGKKRVRLKSNFVS